MFKVIAVLPVKKEYIEDVKPLLNELVKETLKEKECLGYECSQDMMNECVFIFQEKWPSDEALDKHMKTSHFVKFGNDIASMVNGELSIHKIML